jgi:hypothetical protein
MFNETGAFCRLLAMVAEVEHEYSRGMFGLERRMTPLLVETALQYAQTGKLRSASTRPGGWRALLFSISEELAAINEQLQHAESTLKRLKVT